MQFSVTGAGEEEGSFREKGDPCAQTRVATQGLTGDGGLRNEMNVGPASKRWWPDTPPGASSGRDIENCCGRC